MQTASGHAAVVLRWPGATAVELEAGPRTSAFGGVHRRRTKLLRLLDARLARPIATTGRHHHSAQLRDGWGSCFGLTDTALVRRYNLFHPGVQHTLL